MNDDRLAELWSDEGLSMSQIASLLEVSRGTVAGRVDRLRKSGDDRFKPRPSTLKIRPAPRPAAATTASAPAGPKRGPLLLWELQPGQCRFPVNDPPRGGKFLFCAESVSQAGANYCASHAQLVNRR
jgi:hypothetical protein